ncbi:hypothetical protein [Silvimonas amylolytica]|nr:hypothetical protein [Silvimonas amylolytica]
MSQEPQSPKDCPTNTTFGQVQNHNVCVTNAPLPSQASQPASQTPGPSNTDNPANNQTGTNANSSLPRDADGCMSGCTSSTSNSTSSSVTGSTDGAGNIKLDIPNDYNKETTQQSILNALTDFKSPEGSDGMADKYKGLSDDFQKKATDQMNALAQSGSIDGYHFGWDPAAIFASGGQAPRLSITLPFGSVSYDFSDGVSRVRDIFGWILYILTAFSLFRVFTGGKD